MRLRWHTWLRAIPNALTLLRVPLGILLPFLAHSPAWFSIVLGVALLSDIADGWMARRLNVAGGIGARFDSAADIVFYLGAVLGALLALPVNARIWPIILIGTVTVIRFISALIARTRFGTWASIHTTTNRVTGGLATIMVWWCVWFAEAPVWLLTTVTVFAVFASLEELWMVSTTAELDVDHSGVVADFLFGSKAREHR